MLVRTPAQHVRPTAGTCRFAATIAALGLALAGVVVAGRILDSAGPAPVTLVAESLPQGEIAAAQWGVGLPSFEVPLPWEAATPAGREVLALLADELAGATVVGTAGPLEVISHGPAVSIWFADGTRLTLTASNRCVRTESSMSCVPVPDQVDAFTELRGTGVRLESPALATFLISGWRQYAVIGTPEQSQTALNRILRDIAP